MTMDSLMTDDVNAEQASEQQVAAVQAFNRGNVAYRQQQWELALAAYARALELGRLIEPAALQSARCLVQLQRWMPAREAFASTLRINPANYSAWLEAGHLCRQMGELAQAATAYQRAMAVAPARYEAPLGLARTLEQGGDLQQGEAAYLHAQRAAAQVDLGTLCDAHHHMARYRLERGDPTAAMTSLRAALTTAGQSGRDVDGIAEIQLDLGEALLRIGQRNEAYAMLSAASAATGEPTLARLAALSFRHNLWQEGLEISHRNVELHPESPTARWNLAHLLAECWQMDEAEKVLREAEVLAPMPNARSMRASIAGRQGDADGALALYRELASEKGAPFTMASSAAMSSLYSDKLSAQEVADLHCELFAPLGKGARSAASFVRAPLTGRRVKLGIVSADFHHQHPVNIFMQPVLRELDRSKFEVFLYFTGVSYDDQTQLARQRVEHWVEVTTLNDVQLAKRIDADGIDLLLDLAGHTGQQRMPLFAQRAAPVQCTYLGYPGSTGVPNIDWVLGDEIVTPVGSEALCSERIARLSGVVFCYAPETDYPFPTYSASVAKRTLTFGSFNNVPKLTPHTLQLWARVLAAVPDSRLVLKAPSFSDAGAIRLFGERLHALGVDLARVEFRGPTGLTDMMAEYADIDIALDPIPYNGGTTTLQAMWMGVPVICKRGNNFVSRMGASFMTAACLPEWVAEDDEAYVAIAQRMSSDRKALHQLKKGLRKRLQNNTAWDVVQHTRHLEDAIQAMLVNA